MRTFRKQWIIFRTGLFVLLNSVFGAHAQQYFNLFDHAIESPPKLFGFSSSQPPSKIFRAKINRDDFSFEGRDYKVRTYQIPKFGNFIEVTCIYSSTDESNWRCERARFFHAYQGSIFKMNTANLLCSTIHLNPNFSNMWAEENRTHWRKTEEGVWTAGNPPWVSAFLANSEHVIVAKLSTSHSADPIAEVVYTVKMFDALDTEAAGGSSSHEQKPMEKLLDGGTGSNVPARDVPSVESIYN